eukprot:3403998-Rhodomonas_salina.1
MGVGQVTMGVGQVTMGVGQVTCAVASSPSASAYHHHTLSQYLTSPIERVAPYGHRLASA